MAQRIDVVEKLFGLKERKYAEERQKESGEKFGKGMVNLPQPISDKGKSSDKLCKKAKVSSMSHVDTFREFPRFKEFLKPSELLTRLRSSANMDFITFVTK